MKKQRTSICFFFILALLGLQTNLKAQPGRVLKRENVRFFFAVINHESREQSGYTSRKNQSIEKF